MRQHPDQSTSGVWVIWAAVLASAAVIWTAWPSGPDADKPDRNVPGATTGPGKNAVEPGR